MRSACYLSDCELQLESRYMPAESRSSSRAGSSAAAAAAAGSYMQSPLVKVINMHLESAVIGTWTHSTSNT
jgi:hypothetical protein